MAITKFEDALRGHLEAHPQLKKKAGGRRIQRILNLPESNDRRARVLARMESEARLHAGLKQTGKVDWATAAPDFNTIFEFLMEIVQALMKIFGMF